MADYDEANYFEATDGSIRPRVGKGDPDGFERMVQQLIDGNLAPIKYAPNKPEELLKKEGVKYDNGKSPFWLIPLEPLFALADLYGIGAKKYEPENWRKGMDWDRVFSAMIRHALKWWGGEKYDKEDGQHHLISVAWCAFALFWYELKGVGKDTRYLQ